VPTLRGAHATAPYLHDGSAETLTDALGEAHAGRLTARQTTLLVAYLSELEGEALEVEGCGCRTGGGAWWLGVVGLGLRRRRR
jgi:MYXO-CTERM domain-containing protein